MAAGVRCNDCGKVLPTWTGEVSGRPFISLCYKCGLARGLEPPPPGKQALIRGGVQRPRLN